jgi:hypothetical protein
VNEEHLARTHPGGETSVVRSHEVGCVHTRVLTLEVRESEIEVDLEGVFLAIRYDPTFEREREIK